MLTRSVTTAVRQDAHVVYVTVAVCVTLAGVAMLLAPKLYGADGSMLVTPATFLDPGSSDALPELSGTIVALASSPAVFRGTAAAYTQAASDPAAAEARRKQATTGWLRRHVEVRPAGTSSLLEVSATAPRSRDAVDLAAAHMGSLQRFVASARTRDDARRPAGIRVVPVAASRPRGLVSPNPVRDSLVGLGGGLLLGCALAVLLSRTHRRASPQRVAGEVGVPWLGTFTPARAGGQARAFVEDVAASQRRPGHVVLVTGGAPGELIDRVAQATVEALNERATRGLLVDGELGVRALRRRLTPAPERGLGARPEAGEGSWAALPAPPPPPALVARATTDDAALLPERALEPVRPSPAPASLWPEYEFVVMSGPSAGRFDELRAVIGALHCVVVLVGPNMAAADLEAIRALAREARTARAVVGVIGVTEDDIQANSSS